MPARGAPKRAIMTRATADEDLMAIDEKNVLGGTLATCSVSPLTGFFRDGCCNTGPDDRGLHVVCVQVTANFLDFARSQG